MALNARCRPQNGVRPHLDHRVPLSRLDPLVLNEETQFVLVKQLNYYSARNAVEIQNHLLGFARSAVVTIQMDFLTYYCPLMLTL